MRLSAILLAASVTVACAGQAGKGDALGSGGDTAGAQLIAGAQATAGAPREGNRYANTNGAWNMDIGAAIKAQLTTESIDKSPDSPLPLRPLTRAELEEQAGPVLYRLGHSTLLIQLDGKFLLTDPVFSLRASPVQWAGPRRFHPAPIDIADLPDLTAVIISHDHYDHLDKDSIRQLAGKVEYFLVPLGVGDHLRKWGIEDDAIIELDWWEEVELDGLLLAATPAQHFSGRGLTDRNRTLWASWVIRGAGANLFFSGDTGYFDGFKDIGERYGPFDITMIENGAYNLAWRDIHMMPRDSIQAHLDLGGKAMLPIHNSTFDLSLHAWYEPLEQTSVMAEELGVDLLTPVIGAPVQIDEPQATFAWWRETAPEHRLAAIREQACQAC